MKTGYAVLKNFLYMLFSNAVTKILGLITVIYLANILGPENFGKLNWALVLVSYFAVLADFGSSMSAARDISRKKSDFTEIFMKTVNFRIFFGITAFLICCVFSYFISKTKSDFLLLFFSSLTIFSSVTFFSAWAFQGLENMKSLGYSLILQSFVYTAAVLLLSDRNTPIYEIVFFLFISQMSAVFFQLFRLKINFPSLKFKINFSDIKKEAFSSFHIAWSHFTLILNQNSPLFLIGLLSSPQAAGFFAASQKISSLIWEVISNFSNVLFPAMSKHYKSDEEKLNKIANYSLKIAFSVLSPILALIAVLSYSITEFIYGNGFIESYWTLKILIFLPLFMFLENMASNLMIIASRQKESSAVKTYVSSAFFIIYLLSAKKLGINFVSVFFCLSFLISAFWQYEKAKNFLKIDWLNCVLLPILFSAVCAASVFYIKSYSLPLAFVSSAVFYLFLIYISGVFGKEEISILKDNLNSLKSKFLSVRYEN
ncbi:MAG: flippase [Elusimicrobia bacterium]|nr:flippase [Elusimicrobiota bacterium]